METIICTLITAIASVMGAYLGFKGVVKKQTYEALRKQQEMAVSSAKREQEQNDRLLSIDDRLERLEKKVDLHNNYGKKFGECETTIKLQRKDIINMNKGLEELKNEVKLLKKEAYNAKICCEKLL